MTDTANSLVLLGTGSFRTSFEGFSVPTTIIGQDLSPGTGLTPHTWVANADGLYVTATDLAAEWQADYAKMLAGQGSTMTAVQRMEGNAEAVFENTGLSKLRAPIQEADRQDVQRELDAIAAGMSIDQTTYGIDPSKELDTQTYAQLEHTIQFNNTLEELAVQGHGLNQPPSKIYDGYTTDFQNVVDNKTLYVGGGSDNGEKAIASFFDDDGMTHVPFPTIAENGQIEQLNQNGTNEDPVAASIAGMNQTAYERVYVAGDFSQNAAAVGPVVDVSYPGSITPTMPVATAGQVTTLDGSVISGTLDLATNLTPHTWVANANGLYQTTTNLAAEWKADYAIMLAGNGATLSAVQRMEGNAEAVFENTNLSKLSAAQQEVDREDAQREFDAIGAAMQIDQQTLGIDPTSAFTATGYLQLEHTIQGNEALEELALQGHGLNAPPAAKYDGFTNDFQNNVDDRTLYVGGGVDNGETAIASLFDDTIMTHAPFPTVMHNGTLAQLNQNGAEESSLATAVAGINQTAFGRVYVSADFSKVATATGPVVTVATNPTTLQVTTQDGTLIAPIITTTAHTWVADDNGLYTTSTNLAAEWSTYYSDMTNPNYSGPALTAEQRLEGNAEAVFENTGLSNLSAAQQQVDREDAQREFDAIGAAMQIDQTTLGISATAPFTTSSYLALEHTIQSSETLEELAVQGHGLNNPSVPKYDGFTNDFQNNVDSTTLYVGPGPDHGDKAVAAFFDDAIMTHVPFGTVTKNNVLIQLNQNGTAESTVAQAIAAMNATMFTLTLTKADFATS